MILSVYASTYLHWCIYIKILIVQVYNSSNFEIISYFSGCLCFCMCSIWDIFWGSLPQNRKLHAGRQSQAHQNQATTPPGSFISLSALPSSFCHNNIYINVFESSWFCVRRQSGAVWYQMSQKLFKNIKSNVANVAAKLLWSTWKTPSVKSSEPETINILHCKACKCLIKTVENAPIRTKYLYIVCKVRNINVAIWAWSAD